MKTINNPNNLREYLENKERKRRAMNKLKHEVASELGYDHVKIPYSGADISSYEMGVHAGPVGGLMVKELIAQGEKALLEKNGKD